MEVIHLLIDIDIDIDIDIYIYISVSDMFCYVLLLFMSKSRISSWKNPLKNPGYEPPATCGHLPISV